MFGFLKSDWVVKRVWDDRSLCDRFDDGWKKGKKGKKEEKGQKKGHTVEHGPFLYFLVEWEIALAYSSSLPAPLGLLLFLFFFFDIHADVGRRAKGGPFSSGMLSAVE